MTPRVSPWPQWCLRSTHRHPVPHHPESRRFKSSNRRLQKSLKVKPHSSFLPSSNTTSQSFVAYNPPAAPPSIYITPRKFLPKSDQRRDLHDKFEAELAAKGRKLDTKLPPPIRQPYEKRYHLSLEQIAEIRALRTADPATWTRLKLAEKFDCSQLFVAIVCEASKEQVDKQAKLLELVKSGWGRRRREAREDRTRRKATWGYEEGVTL